MSINRPDLESHGLLIFTSPPPPTQEHQPPNQKSSSNSPCSPHHEDLFRDILTISSRRLFPSPPPLPWSRLSGLLS